MTERVVLDRTISGRGVLQVPVNSDDIKKARTLTVFAQLLRPPQNRYVNIKYNPENSFYGYICLVRRGYVMKALSIDFERQRWDFSPNLTFQNLIAIQCAYQGILETFVNLGIQLSSISPNFLLPEVTNDIKDWTYSDLNFDEIKLVCYTTSGIRIRLSSIPFDFCEDNEDNEPTEPPEEPPPEEPVPVDQPIEVSPSYDGNGDNGDTQPLPLDVPPVNDEDIGAPSCTPYAVRFRFRFGSSQDWIVETRDYYGLDEGITVVRQGNDFSIRAGNQIIQRCITPCIPGALLNPVLVGFPDGAVEILSFTRIDC